MPRKSIKGNVDGCVFHTRKDERGGPEIRIGECTGYCRIHASLTGRLPLTEFLKKLDTYSDADLAKADPAKAAKVYGINPDHATGYIRMRQQQRGMQVGQGGIRPARTGKVSKARKRRTSAA